MRHKYFSNFGVARFNYTMAGRPLTRRLRRLSSLEQREEARTFLKLYCDASGATRSFYEKRWADVRSRLSREGFYEHTPEELAYGARIAWRNHSRCIGRLLWETLSVVDCRHLTEPAAMAHRVDEHMSEALNHGRIRSVISIFAPVRGTDIPAYIESSQITQYAGYLMANGSIIGDRQNVEATRIAKSLGWQAPETPGQFDILPYVIRDQNDRRAIFSLRASSLREVEITHPVYTELSKLNLRWYSVPCVSDMILTIGGIDYPCAPFNGFYMSTEIASRNLSDLKRYNLLPEIALSFALDPGSNGPAIWRDEALTELNRSVVHSFRKADISMLDHHTASDQFIEFSRKENKCGRRVSADWAWIVPPQASSSTKVFHMPMEDLHSVPNYYHSRADDGLKLMPYYGDQYRNYVKRVFDRLMRRWKIWKRIAW